MLLYRVSPSCVSSIRARSSRSGGIIGASSLRRSRGGRGDGDSNAKPRGDSARSPSAVVVVVRRESHSSAAVHDAPHDLRRDGARTTPAATSPRAGSRKTLRFPARAFSTRRARNRRARAPSAPPPPPRRWRRRCTRARFVSPGSALDARATRHFHFHRSSRAMRSRGSRRAARIAAAASGAVRRDSGETPARRRSAVGDPPRAGVSAQLDVHRDDVGLDPARGAGSPARRRRSRALPGVGGGARAAACAAPSRYRRRRGG